MFNLQLPNFTIDEIYILLDQRSPDIELFKKLSLCAKDILVIIKRGYQPKLEIKQQRIVNSITEKLTFGYYNDEGPGYHDLNVFKACYMAKNCLCCSHPTMNTVAVIKAQCSSPTSMSRYAKIMP